MSSEKKNPGRKAPGKGSPGRMNPNMRNHPIRPGWYVSRRGFICLAALVLLLIIYFVGVGRYGKRFMRAEKINGTRVGGLTVSQAEDLFEQDFASHKITVIEKEREESIKAEDVGTVIDVGDQIRKIHEDSNAFAWPLRLLVGKDHKIDIRISYDSAALLNRIDSMECFDPDKVTEPRDAGIVPDPDGDGFKIEPEVIGNKVDHDALVQRIEEALVEGTTRIDLEEEKLYLVPEYYKDDKVVKDARKKADQIMGGEVVYDLKYTSEVVDKKLSRDWIAFSHDFDVTIDEEKAGDYVRELGRKYNTMGSSREFRTSTGKTVTVYDGDYGWKINFKKERAQLIEDLMTGSRVEREPIYSYTARCRKKGDDIGNSYVEVSISDQKLWLYVNGFLRITSPVVTGKPKDDSATQKGVYALTYKQSPATLTGPNAAGGSYSSEVDFWMPFNGNQGLHNAPWREEFGGSIYRTNGSHGCVNMPYFQALIVYTCVEKGFPVVVY